jgi:GntR family transcriptional regulator/MocR family aminotransferase
MVATGRKRHQVISAPRLWHSADDSRSSALDYLAPHRVSLHVSLDETGELADQVYRQIRAAIADGLLRPGQALPSTRELAGQLNVSRNTVGAAYERLVADGLARSRPGVGTFVDDRISAVENSPSRPRSPLRPVPVWDHIDEVNATTTEPEYDFRSGIPDVHLFPYATWRSLISRHLSPRKATTTQPDPAGHMGLRASLARQIRLSRGVEASPSDMFIARGSHEAIELAAKVLLEPGDIVAVENPGYRPADGIFASLGMTVVHVPVDSDGLVVDAIPDGTRMVFVSPSHQFPLGVTMPLTRRLALLEWATRADGVIVEDDHGYEFRYSGRPIDPLHSLDRQGRVLYLGSLSRMMLPNLHIGFLVAPPVLHAALGKAKYLTDPNPVTPIQAAAAEFIDQGLLARHLRRMRGIYAERRHRLTTAIYADFADHLTPIPSAAGLHITALLHPDPTTMSDIEIVQRASRVGVALDALSTWSVGPQRRAGLLLGHGAIATDHLDEGLRRLRRCLDAALAIPA